MTISQRLHFIAITRGWYKPVATVAQFDLRRTIFGVYFLDGFYDPMSVAEIASFFHFFGSERMRR
jgi:hypothetical protein